MLHWRDWRYSRFLSRRRRVRSDSLLHFYFLFLFECEYFLKVWHWVGFIIRALNLWRGNESYSQHDFLDGIFLLRWVCADEHIGGCKAELRALWNFD